MAKGAEIKAHVGGIGWMVRHWVDGVLDRLGGQDDSQDLGSL